jgi:hypothetical protein
VVAPVVRIEDEEERTACRRQQRDRLLDHRARGAVAQQEVDAGVAAHLVRGALDVDRHDRALRPRAASVSAKKSAEPPWRDPVSIRCSMRRSKMISW